MFGDGAGWYYNVLVSHMVILPLLECVLSVCHQKCWLSLDDHPNIY